jgi:hypothetical protein
MDERRMRATRREHSKGNGNFPDTEPIVTVVERPEDRLAEDLRKERDAELPAPKSGFEEALAAADDATSRPPGPAPRPNARRSSAAKRAALPRQRSRPRVEAMVPRAPKSSAKTAKRAAAARRAQPGKRKTGAARRGGAVPKAARGSVPARKAKKASRAKPRRSSR